MQITAMPTLNIANNTLSPLLKRPRTADLIAPTLTPATAPGLQRMMLPLAPADPMMTAMAHNNLLRLQGQVATTVKPARPISLPNYTPSPPKTVLIKYGKDYLLSSLLMSIDYVIAVCFMFS